MNDKIKKQILDFVEEEAKRVGFGKLIIEITVAKGVVVIIQGETKRSKKLG